MSDEDISTAMLSVESGPMLVEHKRAVIASLNNRVDSGGDSSVDGGRRRVPVSCESIRFYFTHAEWTGLLGASSSLQKRLELVVSRVVALGYWNPTERSFAAIAAVVLFGAQDAEFADQRLTVLRDAKTLLKSVTAKRVLGAGNYMDEPLPQSPTVHKEKHPSQFACAFPKDIPVDPPGDDSGWRAAVATIPCRSTRAGRFPFCQQCVRMQLPKTERAI